MVERSEAEPKPGEATASPTAGLPASALVRGIRWDGSGPSLSFTTDDGDGSLPLSAGHWLRFSVAPGARRCLGYSAVSGPDDVAHHPCPTSSDAERGYQCGPCFGRDDFRFMHDFHRSGIAPPGLKLYLAQEHWLYVATFADGTTKVGTASARSRFSRLAEQGAVVAAYVAHAADGRVVRLLEDLATQSVGLTQFVRSAAKHRALLAPRPGAELAALNAAHAAAVRSFLATVELEGFDVVDDPWQRPALAEAVCGPGERHDYPQALDSGSHGLQLSSLLGPYALVRLDGSELDFLVDLSALKGRVATAGGFTTEVPSVQESLF
ncbi:DUF2797 domain-containing protein [Arthrobacter sp. 35W]|uniref:DUF2797 domain-containing protein n=1 Tax=Arthrobacter sp. 35W TaxID=1132441 RepID=UPI00040781E9|nr:DUF2797 domain-containing protein [Arthrobacter sp. 35W]